jgi:hypothetical protein
VATRVEEELLSLMLREEELPQRLALTEEGCFLPLRQLTSAEEKQLRRVCGRSNTYPSRGEALLLTTTTSEEVLLQQAIFIEEETVEASGEVVLPMQETTTEVLLDKMVVTTLPTSLKRRWSSSSNT